MNLVTWSFLPVPAFPCAVPCLHRLAELPWLIPPRSWKIPAICLANCVSLWLVLWRTSLWLEFRAPSCWPVLTKDTSGRSLFFPLTRLAAAFSGLTWGYAPSTCCPHFPWMADASSAPGVHSVLISVPPHGRP